MTAALLPVEFAAQTLGAPGVVASVRLNLFTQFAFAGALLMYLLSETDIRRRRWALLATGAVATGAIIALSAGRLDAMGAGHAILLSAGTIGIAWLGYASLAASPQQTVWRHRLAAALTVLLGVAVTPFFLWLSFRINPVDDLYILAFEDTLGYRPSVVGVTVFNVLPLFGLVCSISYIALPLGIVALHALQPPERSEHDIIIAFVVAAVIGYGLYFVFPVVGPLTAFLGSYPLHLPPIGTVQPTELILPESAPRNGMPSLHAAWALLVWFNARPLDRVARLSLRAFAACNLFATMGLPDTHWLTDLVVSLPMTVVVQAICNTGLAATAPSRWRAIVVGSGFVGAWFAALWWGLPAFRWIPGLSWTCIVATVLACGVMERALWRRAGRGTAADACPTA